MPLFQPIGIKKLPLFWNSGIMPTYQILSVSVNYIMLLRWHAHKSADRQTVKHIDGLGAEFDTYP